MQSIEEIDVKGKRVLVRVDTDVSLENGKVLPEGVFRLEAAIPTIDYLAKNKAKVILMGHAGRPEGKIVEELRLDPVAAWFSEKLGKEIIKINEIVGPLAKEKSLSLKEGEILMLENLRFDAREEANSQEFSEELASLAEIYVNESFATCHREHASIVGVPQILPACAGIRLIKEIEILGLIRERPRPPFTLIIGGVKAETKVGVITNLMQKADNILIGGALANNFFKVQGFEIGLSKIDEAALEKIKEINLSSAKIKLPVDVVVAKDPQNGREIEIVEAKKVPRDKMILDIGPETIRIFKDIIKRSGEVIWNGPMGLFEKEAFMAGTEEIAKAISESKAKKIAGGGDSLTAILKLGIGGKFDHLSVGGGAMLEFLEGKDLPGILALK